MIKKNRFLTIGLIGLTLSFSQAYAANKKIKIGWVFAMANAPVVIAQQKGFYKEVGLDAEIISFTSGPIVHQALAAGQLDMAYIGSPPVYHWYSRGLKSKILAKVNYGQAAVVARKDSGINNIKDLKGKKLAGVKKGSGMDVLLRGYVLGEANGLNPDTDLRIVPMPSGNMGPSVESGTVDAAFMWEPFTSQSLLRGNTKVIFDMNEAVPKYPWFVVMSPPEFLKNNSDTVYKALKAHRMAVDYLNSGPEAGNEIIAQAFNLKDVVDDKGVTHSAIDVVKVARERIGWEWELKEQDLAFVQRLMDWSKDLRFIKRKLTPAELVDVTLAKQLSDEIPENNIAKGTAFTDASN
ncbi:MAG: ABC transporter substrate-binding protein [Gammaproteobacteria bacterium]|nr:ABC transporter substrate-binding protein [Gammaproteobacteria bacterium]